MGGAINYDDDDSGTTFSFPTEYHGSIQGWLAGPCLFKWFKVENYLGKSYVGEV